MIASKRRLSKLSLKGQNKKGEIKRMSGRMYEGQLWRFENEALSVSMDDVTFQRYLNAYLASRGSDTRTYLQLLLYVDRVLDQRLEAMRHLENPEYWREINDPDVRVRKYGSG
jgi:hypothetical protein